MTDVSKKKMSTKRGADRGRAQTRFRSLLVPVDLTPASDRVLGRVALLPLDKDAHITLLHVIPKDIPVGFQPNARRNANKLLMEEARHLRKSLPRTVRVETVVNVGAPAKAIATCAKAVKAGLIVMGRGGRALDDLFLGSTAERVIRQTRLPVLVVRLAPRNVYTRPAIALDFDKAAQQALQLTFDVLQAPRPTVNIIHAFDNPYFAPMYTSLSIEQIEEMRDQYKPEAMQKLAKLLTAAMARVPPEDALHAEFHVRHGSPRMVIQDAVRKVDTDLLVLGTHGYSGLTLMFIGTVAGDVLRNVSCDVLMVPPQPPRGEQ
jgi:nucleotide-binding universal stress UspA family protein